MADPEGNPPAPNDPRYVRPSQLKPVAPAPRVNPPNVNSVKESAQAGAPAGYEDFLEWQRSRNPDAKDAGAAQRSLIPKDKKKFQRRDAEGRAIADDAPDAQDESASALGDADDDDDDQPARPVSRPLRGVVSAPEPTGPRTRRQQKLRKRNSWAGLVTQLFVLALLVGSFFLGRKSVSKVAAPPPAAPAAPVVVGPDGKPTVKLLSDVNAALIDQAMSAEQANDFKTATELLQKVKDSGEHVHGLAYQLALLAVFSGDKFKAVPLLNDALNEGEDLGRVYNLRGALANQTGLLRGGGGNEYETATKLEPFEAQYFYFWGESLRRAGKSQAALVRLKQAFDRLHEPALASVYQLKIRLTQIELDQDKEFADELAKQLAAPLPDMDWLLTAAALELHRGHFAAGAAYLDRAAQRGDADTFATRLRDFFFFQFKSRKEVARFYEKSASGTLKSFDNPPVPSPTPTPDASAAPAIGLDVPVLPPPASPGATVPR